MSAASTSRAFPSPTPSSRWTRRSCAASSARWTATKHDQLLAELFHTGANILDVLPDVWSGKVSTASARRRSRTRRGFARAEGFCRRRPRLCWVRRADAAQQGSRVRGLAGNQRRSRFMGRTKGRGRGDAGVGTRVGADGDESVTFGKDHLRVPCGRGGWLEVTELQPPGKGDARGGLRQRHARV